MKKTLEKRLLKNVKKAAYSSVLGDANQTCMFAGYQPKAPVAAKKLKKFV